MVRHIVMWKLKENALGADKKTNAVIIKKKLEGLQGIVPGAHKIEVGMNYSPGGYDVVLCSEFSDYDALEGYRLHPGNIKAQEFVREVVSETAFADYMI